MAEYTVGDIALVTQKDGTQYVGIYVLAPGIEYYWRGIVPGTGGNQLVNPDVSAVVIGRFQFAELGFCPTDFEPMPCMTCGAGL